MSDSVIYRVLKLSESLLTALRGRRDQTETNAHFLADAVDCHLPRLVEELQRLGFGSCRGGQRAARLPRPLGWISRGPVGNGQVRDCSEVPRVARHQRATMLKGDRRNPQVGMFDAEFHALEMRESVNCRFGER
jgi:hypothetical protein